MRGCSNFTAVSSLHIGSRQVSLFVGRPFGDGFALSHCWLALGVAFGRPNFAVVSSYHIVGSRQVKAEMHFLYRGKWVENDSDFARGSALISGSLVLPSTSD